MSEAKPMNFFSASMPCAGRSITSEGQRALAPGLEVYKAVTHDMVTAMVRDHMVEFGIVSYPVLVESVSLPKKLMPK